MNFLTRAVAASVRSSKKGDDLTHVVAIDENGERVLCKRVKLESLLDDSCATDENAPATCATCAKRDERTFGTIAELETAVAIAESKLDDATMIAYARGWSKTATTRVEKATKTLESAETALLAAHRADDANFDETVAYLVADARIEFAAEIAAAKTKAPKASAGWTLRRDGETIVDGPYRTRREALEASGIATAIVERTNYGVGAYEYRSAGGSIVYVERLEK